MHKSCPGGIVAIILIMSAPNLLGGQKSSPPDTQQAPTAEAKTLRPEDFPLKAEIKKGRPIPTPSEIQIMEATSCKGLKGTGASACKEAIESFRRAIRRVVAKINEHLYALDGPQVPAGDYPARSIDDGKGFEFLTKDEKGSYHLVRYSIFQEIKSTAPPKMPHH